MFFFLAVHQDCQHNTAGDHCEKCQGGFLGNNSLDGQAVSCSSCPCPLRVPSNKSVPSTSFTITPPPLSEPYITITACCFSLCVVLQRVVCRKPTGCSVCVCRVTLDRTVKGTQPPQHMWLCCEQRYRTPTCIFLLHLKDKFSVSFF